MMTADSLGLALEYCKREWSPLPVPYRGKAPSIDNWPSLRIAALDAPRYFNGERQNIGILLGRPSKDIVDIDLDCPEALALADQYLPTTKSVFGRASKPRAHRLYRAPDAQTVKFVDPTHPHGRGMLLELRATGCQTLFPGSMHPSGEPIEWESDGEVASIAGDELEKQCAKLAVACLVHRHLNDAESEKEEWLCKLAAADPKLGDAARCWLRRELAPDATSRPASKEGRQYALAVLAQEVEGIAEIGPGDQSDRLNEAARKLAKFGELSSEEIKEGLAGAVARRRNDLEREQPNGKDILETIESGIKAARGHVPPGDGDQGRPTPKSSGSTIVNDAPSLSEQWLALEFVKEHANDLRYTAVSDRWYIWNGKYWTRDEKRRVFSLAQELCRRTAKMATGKDLEQIRKTLNSAATRAAVISLAREHPTLAMHPNEWDADPWLLGTPDGAVDLQTGQLRVPRPEDYISMITAVAPGGECPIWKKTLLEIFGTEEMVKYHQRVVGYCATGSVQEEKLFLFAGEGRNGKGTFIETVLYCLGDYGTTVAMSTLMETRYQEHPTEIAKLYKKRLAVSSEQSERGVWNTARIKNLTGGDKLTGRYMRADYFDFDPTHKLVVSTNAMPSFGRVDTAIAERILKTEFKRQFVNEHADRGLKEKLHREAPGILAWLIEGCLEWQQIGLQPPPDVKIATADYLRRADDVMIFIDDECVKEKGAEVYTDDLHMQWVAWCERNGTAPGSRRSFTERVQGMFATEHGKGNKMKVIGLRLRNPATDEGEMADHPDGLNPGQPGFIH